MLSQILRYLPIYLPHFMKYIYRLTIALAMLFYAININAQARSNIGVGYGMNRPYSADYISGSGFMIQGAIAVTDKIAVVPAVGYEHILADKSLRNIPNRSYYVVSSDIIYMGASAKYHFYKDFFAKAGPVIYAAGGNEDIANIGIGGSGAIGYNLNLDRHSTLELSAGTMIINIPPVTGNGTTSIASFKIAYAFNFRRLR
jgi:hypothetical protein